MTESNASPLPASERDYFFAAQKRHRASALRWAIAMGVVVGLVAVTISALLAPLAYAVIGLLFDLLNLLTPMPDLLGRLGRELDAVLDDKAVLPAARIASLVVVAAVPGLIALVLIWRRLGRVFGDHHVEALHAELALRDPRPTDLDEQQLRNLVDEMAIAAGRPPPRLLMMDSEACNIALLGDGAGGALIVTRGLLDRLDRAQTLALVGQATAALGDGDGLLAQRLLRLDAVMGLLMLLAQVPVSGAARAAILTLMPWRRDADGARDIGILDSVLTDPLAVGSDDSTRHPGRSWRDFALMPVMGSVMIGILIVPVATLLLVAPLGGLLWRRRRLLADAMAVQFTRDPQALAEAYAALADVPTGFGRQRSWLGDLFMLDTHAASNFRLGSPYPKLATRVTRLNAMGAAVPVPNEQRRVPDWAWLAIVPLGGVLVFLCGLLVCLGVYVSVALNGFFLALPTILLHGVLRHVGHP